MLDVPLTKSMKIVIAIILGKTFCRSLYEYNINPHIVYVYVYICACISIYMYMYII